MKSRSRTTLAAMMQRSVVDTAAVAAAVGVEPSTVRSWASHGKIRRVGRAASGSTLYDLGEVLAFAAAQGIVPSGTAEAKGGDLANAWDEGWLAHDEDPTVRNPYR